MKRGLFFLAIGIGLLPWMWVGSYVTIRFANPDQMYGLCIVELPEWASPLTRSYQELSFLDHKLTGKFIYFGSHGVFVNKDDSDS